MPENEELKKRKRRVDVLVISDVHLGTYGCHAKELLKYLKSIKPKTVILNGDIIDMWQFSKRYWPKSHMMVIHHIIKWVSKGVKVHYITGNHDEMLRKFAGFKMGSLEISNKLLLDLNDQKTWIFHGDVFDVTMEHSRWLAKLGAHGYDLLILINAAVNWFSVKVGGEKLSLSKNIKNGVKSAVKFINQFEQTAADIAIENGYETVICGHIHQPEMRTISTPKGQVQYLNSGDWIENLSALEYHKGTWRLYHYQEADFQDESIDEAHAEDELLAMKDGKDLFQSILGEFQRESNYVIKSSK